MTFLPIIERELRVRARGRGSYWTRVGVGLVAILICVPQLANYGPYTNSASVGKSVFDGLIVTGFLLCCGVCLLAAETLGVEQREGTLGLLLLTRVRTLDVLVGKLGASGITGLCVLVTLMPVLMVPVLAGGVTGGETARKGLALLSVLFLALAVGLFSSASWQERGKAARWAVTWLTLLSFVPFLLESLFPALKPLSLSLMSPIAAVAGASDLAYRSSSTSFWIALGLIHVEAWLFLLGATRRLTRAVRLEDESGVRPSSAAANPTTPSALANDPPPILPGIAALETDALHSSTAVAGLQADIPRRWSWMAVREFFSPVEFLVLRQRGVRPAIWAAAFLGGMVSLFWLVAGRFIGMRYAFVTIPGLAFSLLNGTLMAWAVSRFFLDARARSELELLRTTPAGAADLIADQWRGLKRLLRWPVVVMLLPLGLQVAYYVLAAPFSSRYSPFPNYYLYTLFSLLFGFVNMLLELGATCWLAMWFGLRAGSAASAVLWTVGLSRGVPYVFSTLVSLAYSLILGGFPFSVGGRWLAYSFISWGPSLCILLYCLWLIRGAKRRLAAALSNQQPGEPDFRQSLSNAARNLGLGVRRARHWTPS
jgi:hypothetical protein